MMHIHESQENTQPNWQTMTSSYADKLVSHDLRIFVISVGKKRDDPPLNDQKQVRLNGK